MIEKMDKGVERYWVLKEILITKITEPASVAVAH